jgi:hypothetical protein
LACREDGYVLSRQRELVGKTVYVDIDSAWFSARLWERRVDDRDPHLLTDQATA